jgi:hypothetical protein
MGFGTVVENRSGITPALGKGIEARNVPEREFKFYRE